MKNIIVIALAIFSFLGCSQKCQELDTKKQFNVTYYGENRFGVDSRDKTQVEEPSFYPQISSVQKLATIYFNFDKFNIRPDMSKLIQKNAKILNNLGNKQVILEGNCDELGSKAYNKTLGYKRANSVKYALKANGVNLENMKIVSFGKDNPVCTQRTTKCRAKNRRVNILYK